MSTDQSLFEHLFGNRIIQTDKSYFISVFFYFKCDYGNDLIVFLFSNHIYLWGSFYISQKLTLYVSLSFQIKILNCCKIKNKKGE